MDLIRWIVNLNMGTHYFFDFQRKRRLPGVQEVMEVGDLLGSIEVQAGFVFLAVAMLLIKRDYRRATLVLLVSLLAAGLIFGLRNLVPSQRPEPNGLPASEAMNSFPAAPVLLAWMTLLNLGLAIEAWLSRRRAAVYIPLVILALWITVSQLFLSRHFLTDVLAGMSAGIGLALLCRRMASPRYVPGEPPPSALNV